MSFTVESDRGRGGEVVIVRDVPTLAKALEIVSAEMEHGPRYRATLTVWYGRKPDHELILSMHEEQNENQDHRWVLRTLAERMP